MGMRAAFESYVSFKDLEATKRIDTLASQAQWFEDNSTLYGRAQEGRGQGHLGQGDHHRYGRWRRLPGSVDWCQSAKSNWIRAKHGSKSVTLGNTIHAYNESGRGSGLLEEFAS